MRRNLLALVVATSLLVSNAFAARQDQPLSDPVAEARAAQIGSELRCVVCQSESINDSQADMARDMRQLVRDKITAGWSDERICSYMRARYGDFILLRPPFQTNTYLLWIAPIILIAVTGASLFVFFRRQRKS